MKSSTERVLQAALLPILLTCLPLDAVSGVDENGAPGFDVNWYGYFKLDASYDQNQTSHGNFVMWVEPQTVGASDEQFNMTHKQTRIGFNANSRGFDKATVNAKLEFDFYGGGAPENKAFLNLRYAYFTVASGHFSFLAGQGGDILAPLNPSTLNYSVLWGSGNIGYRRPQIRLAYDIVSGEKTTVNFAGGFFRTIGNDLTPTLSLVTEVSDGSDDGTDAGVPSLQGKIDITHKFESGISLRYGVSGLVGSLRSEGSLGTIETYKSNAVAGHLELSKSGGFGISGEIFSGENIGKYQGGIANKNTIAGVSTKGGWASLWINASKKIMLATGFGVDEPDDAGLVTGNRSRNQSVFVNPNYMPIPLFKMGIEVSQWKTDYIGSNVTAEAIRTQTAFALYF